MSEITLVLLFLVFPLFNTEEHAVNELYTLIEKGQESFLDSVPSNQSRVFLKEPSLPINELLEKSSKTTESKFNHHPLPSAVWPKYGDHHNLHNKSKKTAKIHHLMEHNNEKSRGEVMGLIPKIQQTGTAGAVTNRTAQKSHSDIQPHTTPPQQGESEGNANSKTRAFINSHPQFQLQQTSSPRKDIPNRRQDPEENRPGKSNLYQSSITGAAWNNSHPLVIQNRRSSSLLFQFDLLRRESDFIHDGFCVSECRKEKDEREHYCYSEFAVNGIVHDIDVLRKGIRLITLMVTSEGFYKISRLYVTPGSFFFKVHILVVDTYKCSKPCPEIKLGTRYIVMGQIYHRRRHISPDLLSLLGGKLKPGDGLLRSSNYIKRYNKRRHQRALEATRSRCR